MITEEGGSSSCVSISISMHDALPVQTMAQLSSLCGRLIKHLPLLLDKRSMFLPVSYSDAPFICEFFLYNRHSNSDLWCYKLP